MSILKDWYIWVALLAVLAVAAFHIRKFMCLPTEEQVRNIKEWLKYAVCLSEKELGGGTGQLKLRMVYDRFVSYFPEVAAAVPFKTFSSWVDDSLAWLNVQLDSNKNVKEIVDGYGKAD